MLYLGGYYYENKRFDLALKYYEMAASFDYDPAYECLGYIWWIFNITGQQIPDKYTDSHRKRVFEQEGEIVV